MKLVFDSSSIYKVVKSERAEVLFQRYTIEPARFELGNTLLNEVRVLKKLKIGEQNKVLDILTRALSFMSCISINGSEHEVSEIALKYNLSFYDASYVCLAKRLDAVLVTEDEKLQKKIHGFVNTIKADRLI